MKGSKPKDDVSARNENGIQIVQFYIDYSLFWDNGDSENISLEIPC